MQVRPVGFGGTSLKPIRVWKVIFRPAILQRSPSTPVFLMQGFDGLFNFAGRVIKYQIKGGVHLAPQCSGSQAKNGKDTHDPTREVHWLQDMRDYLFFQENGRI